MNEPKESLGVDDPNYGSIVDREWLNNLKLGDTVVITGLYSGSRYVSTVKSMTDEHIHCDHIQKGNSYTFNRKTGAMLKRYDLGTLLLTKPEESRLRSAYSRMIKRQQQKNTNVISVEALKQAYEILATSAGEL